MLPAHRYLFQLSRKGSYCLAVFDNGMSGSLIGEVATRNVLVKVRAASSLCYMLHTPCICLFANTLFLLETRNAGAAIAWLSLAVFDKWLVRQSHWRCCNYCTGLQQGCDCAAGLQLLAYGV